MKTPKRHHKIPAERAHLDLEPDSWETDHHAQEARWKRKNKIAQLKRTIKRLIKEREHLKELLAIRTIDDAVRAERETLEFAQKHLSVETRTPEIKQDEFGKWLYVIKHPIVKWDGQPILNHKQ